MHSHKKKRAESVINERKKARIGPGWLYFVPDLQNRVTNYRRIRWKVKQASWCLLGRYMRRDERKHGREKEKRKPAEHNAITAVATPMNEDAIYFACLMSSSGNHSCEDGILRQPLRGEDEKHERESRNDLPFVELTIKVQLSLNS